MGLTNVPNGWKSITLDQIVDFGNGKPLEGLVTADGNVNLITLDSVDIQGNLKSDHKKIKNSDGSLRAGDIVSVLSDLAHGNLLGLSAVIPHGAEFSLNQRMGRLRTKGDNSPEFIRLAVNFNQKHFKERGQGTSQRHIYRRDFDQLEILLPPENEQKAIAEALSDIDELILSAKGELGKKRNLYDGVYYDLFKNAGQWQKKTISELGSLRTSTRKQSNDNPESNFVILDMGSIDEKGRVIESKFTNTNDDLLPTGTIVIPKDDIGGGKIIGKGFCVPSDNRYVLGDHVFAFSIFKDNPFFVRYALNFTTSNQEILRIVAGSAQLGLPKSSFLKHSLPVPDIAEQDEIASVLFDMENELTNLIEVIEKYEWLKHGMMNDLLTGKVRLV